MYRSRNHRDTFSTYSPVINFTFFIGAVVFGMVLIHPGFLVCSVVSAVIYYLIVKGRCAVKLLAGLIPVFAAVTLINPLLNTQGSRVLFTYMGGRPYTAEALFYGMALAAMFAAVVLWFSCYNVVMTSDKFIHMFGRMAPSVSLILTMVLRLVPGYRHRLRQMQPLHSSHRAVITLMITAMIMAEMTIVVEMTTAAETMVETAVWITDF